MASGYGLEKELYLKPVMRNNNVRHYNDHGNNSHPLLRTTSQVLSQELSIQCLI